MLEYFDVIWAPREFGDYKIRAHLTNHGNPRNLAEGMVNLDEILSLLKQLSHEGSKMTFDGCFGKVTKVEIDPLQKEIVLRVKLLMDNDTKSD